MDKGVHGVMSQQAQQGNLFAQDYLKKHQTEEDLIAEPAAIEPPPPPKPVSIFDTIQVTEEMRAWAKKHASERMPGEYKRFDFTEDKRLNMLLRGNLGEAAFKKYFDHHEIPYETDEVIGRKDNFDFLIYGEKWDVKASGFYGRSFQKLNLFVVESQYQKMAKEGYKWAAQIFVNGMDPNTKLVDPEKCTEATIAGYIEVDRLPEYRKAKRQFQGDDIAVPVPDLYPLCDMTAYLMELKKKNIS